MAKLFDDRKDSENWTGEPDFVPPISLAACLAAAAFIFLLLAIVELSGA